jgi:signal transduction histidine kinase/ligand-binding sensor domain-containing protein
MKPTGFFVRALAVDSKGQVWAGTRSRKEEPAVYSGNSEQLQRNLAPTGPVVAIQPIGNDVFVGTDGRGVFRFSDNEVQRLTFDGTAGGLRSDRVYAIFADREGVIWFGTDRGVSRFDPNAPRVETVGSGAESNFVRTVFQSSTGHLFAGTNRGLYVYDDRSENWNVVSELARNIIYALAEDGSGNLIIGSASGLYISQRKLKDSAAEAMSFTRVGAAAGTVDAIGSIRSLASFRGSTFAASFGRGVEQFQDRRSQSVWPKDAPVEVISLFGDSESRLIVGTVKDGALYFDGQGVTADPALSHLKGTAVRGITRTADGTLWFATGRGVYYCLQNNECNTTPIGRDARAVAASKDEGRTAVWCATTGAGLLKISLDKDLGAVVSQLDAEQGLPSQNAFAVTPQTNDDQIVIGTNRGVVRYSPGKAVPTIFATRIISKRVHQPAELGTGLNLEYPQNSLLLDVGAISSRTFPEQFQYAFVLTDSAGKIIRQRLSRESQFAMEALSPGDYRVTARAFTKDLVPSEPLSFGFNIAKAPFPWTSTALAILLALTLLALLWALLERRRIVATSAALVNANRELAGARLDLANEAERERRRIARDLHDQTLADLRHLLLLSDQLPTNGSVGEAGKGAAGVFRDEIESISQEVRRICEDLSPSVLQNVGFAAALEFSLSHAVQLAPPERKFDYEFDCDESFDERTNLSANVQMQVYRIAQEAVNNICRHAAPKRVRMLVRATDSGGFVLEIEDDGVGFDPEQVEKTDGRGLANMQARASLIEAEISWKKRDAAGTIFTLKKDAGGEAVGSSGR